MKSTHQYWENKLEQYAGERWSGGPSLFAQSIVGYLPKSGRLLELGAGLGQDGLWFASHGLSVMQTDLVTSKMLQPSGKPIKQQVIDMSEPLPFPAQSFDAVYAHLSLHYFDKQRTLALFEEIYSVLKPGGVFAMLVNDVHDSEIGEGQQLEENFYQLHGIQKRYFDLNFIQRLTARYEKLVFDDHGTSYKDQEKGINHLIQFVGKKV